MTFGPHCGHILTTIYSGGCGGSGEVAGCAKCDTVYRFHGGGMLHGAHPVISAGESFQAKFYEAAKRTVVSRSDVGEKKGKWYWHEPGYREFHYYDTELDGQAGLRGFLNGLHDALPWPTCPLCKKKPQEPYGITAKNFRCRECGTFYSENSKKWSKDGEPIPEPKKVRKW